MIYKEVSKFLIEAGFLTLWYMGEHVHVIEGKNCNFIQIIFVIITPSIELQPVSSWNIKMSVK